MMMELLEIARETESKKNQHKEIQYLCYNFAQEGEKITSKSYLGSFAVGCLVTSLAPIMCRNGTKENVHENPI